MEARFRDRPTRGTPILSGIGALVLLVMAVAAGGLGPGAILGGPAGVLVENDETRRLRAELSARPDDPSLEADLGGEYLRLADKSDDTRLDEESRRHLERALKLDPRHAMAMALRGTLRCLEARRRQNAGAPRRVEQGMDQIDKAVAVAPEDLDVRMVRLTTSVHLPRRFEREPQALEDAHWLEVRVKGAPGAKYGFTLAELYLRMGQAYRLNAMLAEAREAWREAVRRGPDTEFAADARRLLGRTRREARRKGLE